MRERVGGEESDASGVSRADRLCLAAEGRRIGEPASYVRVSPDEMEMNEKSLT